MKNDKWLKLKYYYDHEEVNGIIVRISDIAQIITSEDCCTIVMKNPDVTIPKIPVAHTADELLAMLNNDE